MCYLLGMPHIQIRNVPPSVHRRLKKRASTAGMSLSEYLLAQITRAAGTPTREEWLARLDELSAVDPPESSADTIRAERARS